MKNLGMIQEKQNKVTGSILSAKVIQSPVGDILIVADTKALHMLEFTQRKNLENNLATLASKTNRSITWSDNSLTEEIENALGEYFQGKQTKFDFPTESVGTPFQKKVWQKIQKIPYGQTTSYAAIAESIGLPTAHRAVANAVGQNQLAILVPCHRVINKNGKLGGYAGGIDRKEWLLSHEKSPKELF